MIDVNEIRRVNLKRLLSERQIRPSDFARMIGQSPQYVNHLLNRGRGFSEKKIEEFAKALGVDEAEFYKGLWKETMSSEENIKVPEHLRPIIQDALDVLTSGDEPTAMALLQNIMAFRESIRRRQENIALKGMSCGALIRVPQTITPISATVKDLKSAANGD